MNDDLAHDERHAPAPPVVPLRLLDVGNELLAAARASRAGRAARTLTPGLGATLKQTLLAMCDGQRLDDHPSPGPTTAQVLLGAVTITAGDDTLALATGQWAIVPRRPHDLVAVGDAVVLLTVTAQPESDA